MLRSISNPSIGAGELVHLIEIQKPQTSPGDSFGQSITPAVFDTVLTVRAAIEPTAGSEVNEMSQLVAQVALKVTIRYTPTFIGANYRVIWGARVFVVQAVLNLLERNRVLELTCIEVNPQ